MHVLPVSSNYRAVSRLVLTILSQSTDTPTSLLIGWNVPVPWTSMNACPWDKELLLCRSMAIIKLRENFRHKFHGTVEHNHKGMKIEGASTIHSSRQGVWQLLGVTGNSRQAITPTHCKARSACGTHYIKVWITDHERKCMVTPITLQLQNTGTSVKAMYMSVWGESRGGCVYNISRR